MPTSLFPPIRLNDILKIEFELNWWFKSQPDHNNRDFFEFIWHYDHLAKFVEKQNGKDGGMSMNLLDDIETMKQFQGNK